MNGFAKFRSMKPSYSETRGPVLIPDFGKSDVIEIIKQSAIRVNMKAGSQRLLSMKPGSLFVGNSYVKAREARS